MDEAISTVTNGEVTAVVYEEPTGDDWLYGAAFFTEHMSGAVEFRVWRSQKRLTTKAKKELVHEFDYVPKSPIQSSDIRAVPFGRMMAEVRSATVAMDEVNRLKPPTDEVIRRGMNSGDLAGFRNVRDYAAAGEMLQATHEYLLAVAAKSSTPTRDAADALGIDGQRAKNILARARGRYFEDGRPTPEAIALAEKFWELGAR